MLRGYWGFCIAFAGLILLGANNPSQNRSGNRATTYADQESQNHEKIATGISRVSDELEAQKGSSDPYEEERNKREIRDLQAQENSAYWAAAMFWATLFAILMSIIGIGLVWTTFRETRKANEIAKDSAERQLRAYVHPETIIYTQLLDEQNHNFPWGFSVTWKNFGLSPATSAHVLIWAEIVDNELSSNFKFDRVAEDRLPMTFGPNSSLISAMATVSASEIRQIRNGGKVLYLWGWAKYRDMFPDSPERETRFCYRMTASGDPTKVIGPDNSVQWASFVHSTHNSAT